VFSAKAVSKTQPLLTVISSVGAANDWRISAGISRDGKSICQAVRSRADNCSSNIDLRSTQFFSSTECVGAGAGNHKGAEVQAKL